MDKISASLSPNTLSIFHRARLQGQDDQQRYICYFFPIFTEHICQKKTTVDPNVEVVYGQQVTGGYGLNSWAHLICSYGYQPARSRGSVEFRCSDPKKHSANFGVWKSVNGSGELHCEGKSLVKSLLAYS